MVNKFLTKLSRFILNLTSINYRLNHKFQNRNQTTNLDIVMNSLINRGYKPTNIYDIGCFEGKWTRKCLKYLPIPIIFYLMPIKITKLF